MSALALIPVADLLLAARISAVTASGLRTSAGNVCPLFACGLLGTVTFHQSSAIDGKVTLLHKSVTLSPFN